MTDAGHPYAGTAIALATLHGKAEALAPAFAAIGARVITAEGVDTDALGTFSGEIERRLPALEAAIAKARLGMAATGLPLGLATEGSFGPHPVVGFLPLHREIAVLVDDTRGLVIAEWLDSHQARYGGCLLKAGDTLDEAELRRFGFPEHALIVRSEPFVPGSTIHKGLRDGAALDAAIDACRRASPDGQAWVESDLRAHMNPTRMQRIALLAERLVARAGTCCPQCRSPGFGQTGAQPGLPCGDCGAPTAATLSEVASCSACGFRDVRGRSDGLTEADPAQCDLCNP
ncbi:DUF6671 family protein [Lysobacter brunescens]|uniref:DUF6671 family protein n=1 Tax=Lysobacter brunescens TaxID=262323 RepID=A0ABW2YAR2_9GAMM